MVGYSASARLFYGVDVGSRDDVPEWLLRHSVIEEDEEGGDSPIDRAFPIIEKAGVEFRTYGYYDDPSVVLGTSLAWAWDYTSEVVDTAVVIDAISRCHPVMMKLLRDMGAPPETLPKLLLLPSFC